MKYALLTILMLSLPAIAEQPEEQLLTAHSNAFRPDSTTLCLVTEQGDTLTFRDSREKDDILDYWKHYIINYLPEQNIWVLEIHGYEWTEWQLVNGNTGSIQQTIAAPAPSPDGSRLLCMKEDIDAGYIYNGIQIWILGDDVLTLEFEDIDVPWGPINGEWRGNHRIIFDKLTYDYSVYEYVKEPGMLSLDENGNWIPGDADDWE